MYEAAVGEKKGTKDILGLKYRISSQRYFSVWWKNVMNCLLFVINYDAYLPSAVYFMLIFSLIE